MTARKPKESPAATDSDRVTILCSAAQKRILTAAAEASGADRSSWVLAHAMRAAGKPIDEAALRIPGEIADRFRAEAKRQGITVDELLEQLSITITVGG